MRNLSSTQYTLGVTAVIATFAGCSSAANVTPTRVATFAQSTSNVVPLEKPATPKWGIEYQEIAHAHADILGGQPQNQDDGYCSGGGRGYGCAAQPVTTPSATLPPIAVSASVSCGFFCGAKAATSGSGGIALGQAQANLKTSSTVQLHGLPHPSADGTGTQVFTWFDRVIPPRATLKHPKGTPIALTATLVAQTQGGSFDCSLTNYFVALASAPNMPQLNQPGGCPGQAPGTPLPTATWKTSYGAPSFPISGELEVYVNSYVNNENATSSTTFPSITATFYLDPPVGVHYKTASGKCYGSNGLC